MPRPVHFEIHASDPEALLTFYETVFGWTFARWGEQPYWIITTGEEGTPGINGGMLPREGPKPEPGQAVNAGVLTVEVPDCRVALDAALAAGATVAMPLTEMPGVGWLAYVHDPDGNLLGMIEGIPDVPSAPAVPE